MSDPILVAENTESISSIWKKTMDFIHDDDIAVEYDLEMDNLDEEDAEEFFIEMVIPYMNEEITPEGMMFGINIHTDEIGFWDESNVSDEFKKEEVPVETDKTEKETGVAEILDEDGTVIAETTFESNGIKKEDIDTICMYCKKLKITDKKWVTAEIDESKENVSHGICPKCLEEHYPEEEE